MNDDVRINVPLTIEEADLVLQSLNAAVKVQGDALTLGAKLYPVAQRITAGLNAAQQRQLELDVIGGIQARAEAAKNAAAGADDNQDEGETTKPPGDDAGPAGDAPAADPAKDPPPGESEAGGQSDANAAAPEAPAADPPKA